MTRRRSAKGKSTYLAAVCHECDSASPSVRAHFKQNVGALVMHFTTESRGYFCRSCVRRLHWRSTAITFLVGWFGVKSLVLAPTYIAQNFASYNKALRTLDRARAERRAAPPDAGGEGRRRRGR